MAQRDLIVVGASAGGVQALQDVVADLPAGLPATVLVVLHVPAGGGSVLSAVLARGTGLDVAPAVDGEVLVRGTVRIAPPDRHLVVTDEDGELRLRLVSAPRVNGHRPAVDPLFRSAAQVAGARVVGLVLSGSLDDGAAGLRRVRAGNGIAVVQDPDDALHAGMPQAALALAGADHVLPSAEIGGLLTTLAGGEVADEPATSTPLGLALRGRGPGQGPGGAGTRTAAVEAALWLAVRSLEDRALVSDRMARSAARRGSPLSAVRFTDQAADTREASALLRDLMEDSPPPRPGPPDRGGSSTGA